MHMRLTRLVRAALVPAMGLVALTGTLGLAHAAPADNPQPTVAPALVNNPPSQGNVSIWTDAGYYYNGDTVKYCISLPHPGHIRIYDRLPNGQQKVLKNFYEWNQYDCFSGTVTPPNGHEELRLEYQDGGYYDYASTSFWTYAY